MRVLLIAVGSRGDAEPICSLASELAGCEHRVELFLQKDVQHLSPKGKAAETNITVHELPFSSEDFYKFTGNPSRGADHPNPRVKFVGIIADVIAELVLPCVVDVAAVAERSDALVVTSLARPLAVALGDKYQLPVGLVQLQPMVPTGAFPHYSNTNECVDAIMGRGAETEGEREKNAKTYWELERFQFDFLQERLSKTYSDMSLSFVPEFSQYKEILSGKSEQDFVINAFSFELIPPCRDNGPNIFNVGPLADAYVPNGWCPPQDLVAFLESCEVPPVCVGYGSMPLSNGSTVLKALQSLDEKAIVVGSHPYNQNDSEWAEKNIHFITSAPYAWLLPKCSMMLSHGGAGVVNATLRAGIPAIISPFFGDQPFWAALIQEKGLGAQAGSSLPNISEDDLVEAIKRGRECKESSKQLGDKVQHGLPGVKRLVSLLESNFERIR